MSLLNLMITSQSGFCPALKDTVSLTGIYNRGTDGKLHLSETKCPIVLNLEKPLPERDPDLGDTACEVPEECPIYSLFSKTI